MRETAPPTQNSPPHFRPAPSIFWRLVALVSAVAVVFFAAFVVSFQVWSGRARGFVVQHNLDQHDRFLRLENLLSAPLEQFARDPAHRRSATLLLAGESSAGEDLRASLRECEGEIEAVWVVRSEGSVVWAADWQHPAPPPAPFAPEDLRAGLRGFDPDRGSARFFGVLADTVWECHAVSLPWRSPSPTGFLLAGVRWGPPRLHRLQELTATRIEAGPPQAGQVAGLVESLDQDRPQLTLVRLYPGLDGTPVFVLQARQTTPLVAELVGFAQRQAYLTLTLLAAVFGLLLYLLTRWVALPLRDIANALRESRPERLHGLGRDDTELGRLARLVAEFFAQRLRLEDEVRVRQAAEASLRLSEAALRESVRRRERLARDLHDGLIQNLFAIGLQLQQGLRLGGTTLAPALREIITAVCTELNTVMRDVRNFIGELEPEKVAGQDLKTALERLTQVLQPPPGCRLEMQLDAASAARLDREQTVNLFHLAHELLANSLRHSRPSRVVCRLDTPEAGRVRLEVWDDGGGFDTEQRERPGRGLRNLRARVMEMGGTYEIESQPGAPTRIAVDIPTPAP